MRARGPESGFTLIEVLVSMLILASLTLIAGMGISMFLDQWKRDRGGRFGEFADFRDSLLLRSAVEGAYDYYVRVSPRSVRRVPYFRTGGAGFSFVTNNAVWGKGEAALARVNFKSEDGAYILVYEESSLEDKYIDVFDEAVEFENSLAIVKGIKTFKIAYFGAQDLQSAGLGIETPESAVDAALVGPVIYDWYADFNSSVREILPKKVRIDIEFLDGSGTVLFFFIREWHLNKYFLFNALVEDQ